MSQGLAFFLLIITTPLLILLVLLLVFIIADGIVSSANNTTSETERYVTNTVLKFKAKFNIRVKQFFEQEK